MSDTSHASGHDQHAGGYSMSRKTVLNLVFTALLPTVVVVSLVAYVMRDTTPVFDPAAEQQAVAARIQKVGVVEVGESVKVVKTGEQVYQARCAACHATGAAGAPKFGDAGLWGPRVKNGFEALLTSVLKGKNAMPAQAGGDLSDYEIALGVVYIGNAGGAKFAEPKAPEAAK